MGWRELLSKYIYEHRFAQGVLSIVGGTAIGQGVGLLLIPVITELYTPAAMGMWGLFMSFVRVATVGGALRYEVAIVAAEERRQALSLARLAIGISLIMGLLSGGVFEIMRRYQVLGYGIFTWWMDLWVVAAVVVFTWGEILRYWFIRERLFKAVGLLVAGRGMLRSLTQISLSWWQGNGLIGGEVIGRLLSMGMLFRQIPWKEIWQSGQDRVWFRFRRYPLFFLPSAFVNTMALMAPVPIFTFVYGIEVGGTLALAQRIVGLPVGLVGAAVADVFFGEVAGIIRHKTGNALAVFLKSSVFLASIAAFLGILLKIGAPWGVNVLFGPSWRLTGEMLAVMAPWFAAMLVVSPLSRLVFLSELPWVKLIYDVLVLSIFSLPLWLELSTPLEALALIAWSQALLYACYWVMLYIFVRKGLVVK